MTNPDLNQPAAINRPPQVMVIDMLEGFTRVGLLASPRVDALIPRQAEFLRALPQQSLVLFLADEHDPDDFELRRFPPHCLRSTKEAEIRPELLNAARESSAVVKIIRKRNFSGFFRTNLDSIIETAPHRNWIVCGCVTDCCIEANVAELVYRECNVLIARDLIDTWDCSEHQAKQTGLNASYVHDAERINREWFNRRLPAIWGVRVVNHWHELLK